MKLAIKHPNQLSAVLAIVVGLPAISWGAQQLKFKPGFNMFSPAQDVQVGRENATQVDKELPILQDAAVERYVNELGRRLSAYTPNNREEYVWQFKVVNSADINAFALPGGFIYVNRATIEAAQNEAQLAGVIAHEEGHVVMRHGTHQATNTMLAKGGLGILGGLLGGQGGGLTGQLLQYGIGFGVNSIFLKNSRSAESQADEVGTYILYQAGYDPHAMVQFFQIIEQKYPQKTVQFFSDHPNPENRIKKVDEEIPQLGAAKQWKTDSPEFEAVKKRVLSMPPPPKPRPKASAAQEPVPTPSPRLVSYRGDVFSISYPDNWETSSNETSVTLAPRGAIIGGAQGESAQAYGATVSRYQPSGANGQSWNLAEATQRLLESMRQSNPNLRVIKQAESAIHGRKALSTLLENDSPLEGQKEIDELATLRAGDALYALMFIAPQSALDAYKPTFQAMLQSFEVR